MNSSLMHRMEVLKIKFSNFEKFKLLINMDKNVVFFPSLIYLNLDYSSNLTDEIMLTIIHAIKNS